MFELADRDVLLGVLAIQMGFVTPESWREAVDLRASGADRSPEQLLIDRGQLTPADRDVLRLLVEHQVAKHGDPAQTLSALSSLGLESGSPKTQGGSAGSDDFDGTYATREPVDAAGGMATVGGGNPPNSPRYRRLREHARGNLGEVFVAFDEELRREVALKEIKERNADNQASRDRFCYEAEVTGGLEHPGIVPVYGLGQYDDGRPYYAMRFIRGNSLAAEIDAYHARPIADTGRMLTLRTLIGRFVDACQAIAYAHSRGVIHRDLKPGNIMVGKYGETLVVDWGLARPIDLTGAELGFLIGDEPTIPSPSGSLAETVDGSVIGTPAYMPPEQAEGRLDLLGPTSDVYSLGATLYHILTGRPPFLDASLDLLLKDVRLNRYPPPREVVPALPRALDAIVRKAMTMQPADRYPTPLALAVDLEHWLADEPTSALAEGRAVRLARWARHHRSATLSAAATLLGIALIASSAVFFIASARNKTEQALAKQVEATRKTYQALGVARLANESEMISRKAAQDQADKANEVADFLTGLFQETDPIAAAGRSFGVVGKGDGELTARAIVDRGAEAAAQKLRDRPLVRAAVLESIGTAYVGLGEPGLANLFLVESLEIRERLLPADDLDLASSLHALGWARETQFDPSSVTLLQRGLAIRRARLGPEDALTAASMFHLAVAIHGVDQAVTEQTSRLLEESLAIRRKLLGDDSREVAIQLIYMAAVWSMKDRPLAAAPLYLEATRIALKRGETKVATLLTAYVKAEGVERLLGVERSLPAFEACYEAARVAFGRDHFVTGYFAMIRGDRLLKARHPVQAIECYREYLATYRRLNAPGQTIAAAVLNMARATRDTGDVATAEKIAREALDLARSSRQTGSVRAIRGQTCYVLGILIMNRDNGSEEAYRLLVESVDERRAALGPDDPVFGSTLEMLAFCCEIQHRSDEAIARSEEGLALARRHPEGNAGLKDKCEARIKRLRGR